ncbi:MAG TPA: semialdehyde dehydrogenase [Candidatus Atribacteria bacterium]|nr:semialdehyde dehydrogenase [Candidatus Atribacteria bacterium]
MKEIALMGAGGKMGQRIVTKLNVHPEYKVYCVEVDPNKIALLEKMGAEVTSQDEALKKADVVILAVPDRIIGQIAEEIIPKFKSQTLLVGLDPAAFFAKVVPIRQDIGYFVVHPCHPPLFGEETSPEALNDWFGGTAKQDIVCALVHGSEKDYLTGEGLAKNMFSPVRKAHRITLEQMVLLEPALCETFTLSLVDAIREGFEEVVKMGVPPDAVLGFLWGHLRIELGIVFGMAGFPVSDGAKLAMQKGKELIFCPDWKEKIFDIKNIEKSVVEIVGKDKNIVV